MRVPAPALAAIAIASVVAARAAEPIARRSRCVGLVQRLPSGGGSLASALGRGGWTVVAKDELLEVSHGDATWSCDDEAVPLIVPISQEARRLTPDLVPPDATP